MSVCPVIDSGTASVDSASCIFRAPWVVPITSPVLRDGAVVVDHGRIVAVGSYSQLSIRYPNLPLVACQGVLLPALVNAHIHLDLSVMGSVYPDSSPFTMCDWISTLLQQRESADVSQEKIEAAAAATVRDQHASGVGLMLDIGNLRLQRRDSTPLKLFLFWKCLVLHRRPSRQPWTICLIFPMIYR